MKSGEKSVPHPHRVLIGVALIALLHCALWFAYYNQTALGESPALDNRQTLELARAMAEGTLAEEPFHRAPLYPYLLSLLLSLGLPYELLPLLARWLNAFALAVAAASTSWIALRLWGRTACGWVAGLLVALNPVLLFFAGDAFHILLATASACIAYYQLTQWLVKPSISRSFWIGFWLTLGAALRSHLLFLALVWPLAALIFSKRNRCVSMLAATLPLTLNFLLLGYANLATSGEYRVMPWQGSFILWACNGPHAQGRIYTQQIRVEFGENYDNPSKLESIILYEQETGSTPPHSISEMNAYWKNKTLDYIAKHPVDWTLLMFRKAYYFLNNYEQYDNKTYSFHRKDHLQLRLNPIHWGGLLVLAVAGAIAGLSVRETRKVTIAFIILFAIYAAGTILFCTPNRYRLPMVPLLAILSGGLIRLPGLWQQATHTWKACIVAAVGLTLLITYSDFFNALDKSTWEEDYALLANASLRTARDADAIDNARAALAMNPGRSDMYAVLAQAHFNQWALTEPPKQITPEDADEFLQLTRLGAEGESHLEAIAGIYEWKLGQADRAVSTWQGIAASDALARLCLIRTGHSPALDENGLRPYREHPSFPLLLAFTGADSAPENRQDIARFIDALLRPAEPIQPHASPDET